MSERPERIMIDRAASILGLSIRTTQSLAMRGKLPSAAKLGHSWTFNEGELRRHIKAQEDLTWEKSLTKNVTRASTLEARPIGRGSPYGATSAASPYAQAMRMLLNAGRTN